MLTRPRYRPPHRRRASLDDVSTDAFAPDPGPPPTAAVRPATGADDIELVRLRAVMFEAMDLEPHTERWADAARQILADGREQGWLRAAVVDDPAAPGRLAACGVATVERRLPSPRNPTGRHGYIASMVTDPAFRHRGLARQVMEHLLAWFDEQGVVSVTLHASPYGEPLYRSLGFSEPHTPELRLRRAVT